MVCRHQEEGSRILAVSMAFGTTVILCSGCTMTFQVTRFIVGFAKSKRSAMHCGCHVPNKIKLEERALCRCFDDLFYSADADGLRMYREREW